MRRSPARHHSPAPPRKPSWPGMQSIPWPPSGRCGTPYPRESSGPCSKRWRKYRRTAIPMRPHSRVPPGRRARFGLGVTLALAGGVALLLAVNFSGWRKRLRNNDGGPWTHSLALLPLQNPSGEATQDGFADGMTTALIGDLGRIPALRVISKPAVVPFKGTALAPRAIGESLQVDALLQGSVRRWGDRFSIDLALIDASSGKQLWNHRFDEPMSNRFAVQDSVGRGVRAALGLPVVPAEAKAPRTPPTSNLEAYDLYIRGKIRVRHESRESDSVAIALFERAVALDPSFAAA